MYTHYFGFRTPPFTITADPHFFYANPRYRDAYVGLWFSVRQGKQLIVLTGSSGTGKTTLLHKAALQLAPTQPILYLPHSPCTLEELLTTPGLCRNGQGATTTPSLTLEEVLNLSHHTGKTGALFLDEAQDLSPEALESLRHLLDLKTPYAPLLTFVLAGDESLETKFAQTEVHDLQQRIDTLIRLHRLHKGEVGAYIAYRFRAAGRERQDVFTVEAIQQLAHYSKGIPRLINLFCDNALQAAHLAQTQTISTALVDDIAQNLLFADTADMSGQSAAKTPQQRAPVTVLSTDRSPSSSTRYPVIVKHGLDQLAWAMLGVLVAWLSVFQTTPDVQPPPLTSAPAETMVTESPKNDERTPMQNVATPTTPSSMLLAQAPEPPVFQLAENAQPQEEPAAHKATIEQQPDRSTPKLAQATQLLSPTRAQRRQGQARQQVESPLAVMTQDPQRNNALQQLVLLGVAVTEASLLDSVEHGDIQSTRLLLTAGVSPNAKDKEGWTPLMLAARDDRQDLVQTLLKSGARVNAQNKTGGTALIMAAMNNHPTIVDTLISKGAWIDAQAAQGWTALTYASWKGNRDVVEMLLQRGADAHKKDKDGWTPLMYAFWRDGTRLEQENLQRDIAAALGIDGEPLVVASRGDYPGVTQALSRAQRTH